ncbi:MAG: N-acetylneuraminate synthase family protein [Elusimicrobiota bacterium]
MQPANVIAEIGCNHKGEMSIAREMIEVAKIFCKAGHVKFQKRNPRESLSPEEYGTCHPEPFHSYGSTYGEHRETLELTLDQHRDLKEYCESMGVVYSCSVWDMTSTREIVSLKPELIKFPSACNTNPEMLGYVCGEFGGEIHVSLGMTTRKEEEELVSFLAGKGRAKDAVLYACTSGYPVPDEDSYLLEIPRLRKTYGGMIKAVGFSGHHNGIAIDMAAFTLGAAWIERHYTLNRTWKGTDHAASLEPDGLRRLIRDIKCVAAAAQEKPKDILDIEIPQRNKLKWNRPSIGAPLAGKKGT